MTLLDRVLRWAPLGVLCALMVCLPACRRRVVRVGAGGWGRLAVTVGAGGSRPTSSLRWVPTSPPGTGVTVQMPTVPRVVAHTERATDGAARYETMVSAELPAGYFAVFVMQWEAGIVGDPLRSVAESATTLFERADLNRERSRRLSVDGYYGREDVGTNEQGAHVVLRQFVGHDRVVVALAVVNQNAQAVQIATRFLDSIGLARANALFPARGTRQESGAWTALYMPEADFAIAMPTSPTIAEAQVRVDGRNWPVHSFQSRDDWGTYQVKVVDFGDRLPDNAYEELRQQFRFGRDVRPVHVSGFPGRVFVTDIGGRRTWARMYQTSGRLYVVEATGERRSIRDQAVGRTLMRYFDSFRIL